MPIGIKEKETETDNFKSDDEIEEQLNEQLEAQKPKSKKKLVFEKKGLEKNLKRSQTATSTQKANKDKPAAKKVRKKQGLVNG